jgi:hypothetical protein
LFGGLFVAVTLRCAPGTVGTIRHWSVMRRARKAAAHAHATADHP